MTTASDNLNRADETPLAGNWETTDGGGMDLSSNQARTNGFSTWDASNWKASTNDFGDNHYSEATFATLGDFDEIGVTARATANNYYVFASDGNTGAAGNRLIRVVSGTPTTITTYGSAIAAGSVIKLDVNGTTIKVYDDAAEIISTTDSNISTGQPGIAGFSDNSRTSRIDNWSADDGAGSGSTAAGSSDGVGTATGTGESTATSNFSSDGVSTGIAAGASIAESVFSSSGESTAIAVGAALSTSDFSSDGQSTATAEGAAIADGAGDGLSEGSSTAIAEGSALSSADADSSGVSTATAVGSDGDDSENTDSLEAWKYIQRNWPIEQRDKRRKFIESQNAEFIHMAKLALPYMVNATRH